MEEGVEIFSIDENQQEMTIHIGKIAELHNKYLKIQNNWNELKKFVKEEQAKISKNCGTRNYINKISPYIKISDKMQELE